MNDFERVPVTVLELDLDTCLNTYGVAPCTAGRKNSGTAQAGSASTITLAALASDVNDAYKNMVARITGGTGAGQERVITAYVGATKVATVKDAWTTIPDATSAYDVIDRPNACYNTFKTCQDKPNYLKGTKTYSFITSGSPLVTGRLIRPYITQVDTAPTVIDPKAGLSRRASSTITLTDEPDSDVETDPYILNRSLPAQGTFWVRLLARNHNYAGRLARAREGFMLAPFSWSLARLLLQTGNRVLYQSGGFILIGTIFDELVTNLYVIDSIKGPDQTGAVKLVLKDLLKLADRNKIPAPTDGKLIVDFKAAEFSGTAVAAGTNTMTFDNKASSVDGFYVGMAIVITNGFGSGQERVITAYVGGTRVATVGSNWSATPDLPNNTSVFNVQALKLTLDAGKGAQYGAAGYVRLSNEIVRFTTRAGDVLSWPDTTYRAQFGSTRSDHKTNDNAQLCKEFINQKYTDVVKYLLNGSGIADAYIDTVEMASEDDTWLGAKYSITAILTEPETPTDLLAELARDANALIWWGPTEQKVKFKVNVPTPPSAGTPLLLTDEANFIEKSVAVNTLDEERLTAVGIYYGIIDATAKKDDSSNYSFGDLVVDADAESAIEYGDVRQRIIYSRWLGAANLLAAKSLVARMVNLYRNAPKKIPFRLDQKDSTTKVGDLVDIETAQHAGFAGAPLRERMRIVKIVNKSTHIEAESLGTNFGGRRAFIAPNGTPDYPTNDVYAHVCLNSGVMSDGKAAYLII